MICATVNRIDVRCVVINQQTANDFVVGGRTTQALQIGFFDKPNRVRFAIVLNRIGQAFNPFIHAFAFLPEKSQLSGQGFDDAELVTVRILSHLDAVTAHGDAALGRLFTELFGAPDRHRLEAFERQLAQLPPSTYCFGDTPTMADCCLVPQVYNAERFGVDMAPYRTIRRIVQTCLGMDEFKAARPENQPDAPDATGN